MIINPVLLQQQLQQPQNHQTQQSPSFQSESVLPTTVVAQSKARLSQTSSSTPPVVNIVLSPRQVQDQDAVDDQATSHTEGC